MNFSARLREGLASARSQLLSERNPRGYWTGELSSSALSTATAVCALALVDRYTGSALAQQQVMRGLEWLGANVNADGGWGDTTSSLSNLSTTTLCWAAFGAVPHGKEQYQALLTRAEAWLDRHAGGTEPGVLSTAILRRYEEDRTFSVPILTMCALSGRLGMEPGSWAHVIQLPFELAACPPELFAALRLPVVSYALPALIAMGVARHHHLPSRNPGTRLVRNLLEERVMSTLRRVQPSHGGFLEATPLTSFVVMSLAASGYADHEVTRKGVEFLLASARPDGSWPIDTNLTTWLTTSAVNALGPALQESLPANELDPIRDWLLGQQYRERHPYTNARAGGWAWTDLPGGVPDADDTAGALLALRHLDREDLPAGEAVRAGIHWLLELQNRDGGVPTFCRGWGKLAFDQSSADLTAHALRAWAAWLGRLPLNDQARVGGAMGRGMRFLSTAQQTEGKLAGAWKPLWFGDQQGPDEVNWTYGTSRVLLALRTAPENSPAERLTRSAVAWLLQAQRRDGGWGGGLGIEGTSVEESALAVEALAGVLEGERGAQSSTGPGEAARALRAGTSWLLDRVEDGSWVKPSPIGFYFAKLWYSEKLYPLIFTVAALRRAHAAAHLFAQ